MNLSVEAGGDITDAAKIRVAICPVGKITASTFNKYANLIRQNQTVHMAPLRVKGENDNCKYTHTRTAPFVNMDWKNAKVYLKFVTGAEYMTSQFENFQQHRKTYAVIGILDCGGESDIAQGYNKYKQLKSKLQASNPYVVGRCFAVEPHATQQTELPSQDFNIIKSTDAQYMNVLLKDMVAEIYTHLEKAVMSTKGVFSSVLFTASNTQSSTSSAISSSELNEKTEQLKLSKAAADCCLLAGAYTDASNKYKACIEIARLSNDTLMLAGSLEGAACAVLMSSEAPKPSLATVERVVELHSDAIANYGKSTTSNQTPGLGGVTGRNNSNNNSADVTATMATLKLECTMKLARFNATCGVHSRAVYALDCTSAAISESHLLTTQDKIIIFGEVAKICQTLKKYRKFVFFVRESSLLHHQLCNDEIAIKLISRCTATYLLDLILCENQWDKRDKEKLDKAGWPSIQITLIRDLIRFHESINDYRQCVQLILYLIAGYHTYMKEAEQRALFGVLARIIQNSPKVLRTPQTVDSEILSTPRAVNTQDNNHISKQDFIRSMNAYKPLIELPFLKNITPRKLSMHLRPIKTANVIETQNKVFIFSPFEKTKQRKDKVIWVAGEIAHVDVQLCNPLFIDMEIADVKLCIYGGATVSYGVGGTISKCDGTVNLCLSVLPVEPAKLQTLGLLISFRNWDLSKPIFIPFSPDLNKNKPGIKSDKITVTPVLPLLDVRLGRIPGNPTELLLNDGERTVSYVVFENIGKRTIDHLEVVIDNKSGSLYEISQEEISRNLPLLPEKQFKVPLYIQGKWKNMDTGRSLLCVNYGERVAIQKNPDQEPIYGIEYYRNISADITVAVNPGIEVTNVQVVRHSVPIMYTDNFAKTRVIRQLSGNSIDGCTKNYDGSSQDLESEEMVLLLITIANKSPSRTFSMTTKNLDKRRLLHLDHVNNRDGSTPNTPSSLTPQSNSLLDGNSPANGFVKDFSAIQTVSNTHNNPRLVPPRERFKYHENKNVVTHIFHPNSENILLLSKEDLLQNNHTLNLNKRKSIPIKYTKENLRTLSYDALIIFLANIFDNYNCTFDGTREQNEYLKVAVSQLIEWKSWVNTHGGAGYVPGNIDGEQPSGRPQPNVLFNYKQEDKVAIPETVEQNIYTQNLLRGKLGVNGEYDNSYFTVKLGDVFSVNVRFFIINLDHIKAEKSDFDFIEKNTEFSIKIFQHGEDGKIFTATPSLFAFSGTLKNNLPPSITSGQCEQAATVAFFVPGIYKIRLKCQTTDRKKQLIAPKFVTVNCKLE